MKYLRRRTIIRQSDFAKKILAHIPVLYNSAEFVPILTQDLERDHMFKILSQHPSLEHSPLRVDFTSTHSILYHYRDFLYNPRYKEWHAEIDNDGHIWIQSRKNVEPSILGWATAELWYE